MAGIGHPLRGVDLVPDVVGRPDERSAGMDAHPHAKFRPVLKRSLALDGGSDGVHRICERDEERVAFGVNLDASVGLERRTEQLPVRLECFGPSFVAQCSRVLGRALDICEEEGDRPGRKLPHPWVLSHGAYLRAPAARRVCRNTWYVAPDRATVRPTSAREGWRMYTNVVVGTDFSETAEVAVEQAAKIAKAFGASLHIVTAFKPAMSTTIAGSSLEAMAFGGATAIIEAESKIADEVETRLSALQKHYAKEGLKVQTHGLASDPADAIVDVAEACGADLIVVGNRGMGGVKRFVLGSVPNKISHHAPCSVLIAATS